MDAFYCDVKAMYSESSISYFAARLPKYLINDSKSYVHIRDRINFLTGRLMLKELLIEFDLPMSLNEIQTTIYGKPYFENGKHFSISHTNGMVGLALDDQDVGVDCEKMRQINVDQYRELFTDKEWAAIINAADTLDCFFDIWTKKESIAKADGRGFNIEMNSINIQDEDVYISGKPTSWKVNSRNINEVYKLSTCGNKLASNRLREFLL